MSVHTAYLGKVISFNENKADIQPLMSSKCLNSEAQPLPIIPNVPVIVSARAKGDKPLQAGDIVCCICCERDITQAQNGEIPTSSPTGHHSMSDSVIIGIL